MRYKKPKYKIGDIVVLDVEKYEKTYETFLITESNFVQITIDGADYDGDIGFWVYKSSFMGNKLVIIDEEIKEKL